LFIFVLGSLGFRQPYRSAGWWCFLIVGLFIFSSSLVSYFQPVGRAAYVSVSVATLVVLGVWCWGMWANWQDDLSFRIRQIKIGKVHRALDGIGGRIVLAIDVTEQLTLFDIVIIGTHDDAFDIGRGARIDIARIVARPIIGAVVILRGGGRAEQRDTQGGKGRFGKQAAHGTLHHLPAACFLKRRRRWVVPFQNGAKS